MLALVSTIKEIGNPFLDESKDLLTLNLQDIMPKSAVDSIQKIQTLGDKQYMSYIEERFVKNEKPISATIQRNSLPLLSDCALFTRLCLSKSVKRRQS